MRSQPKVDGELLGISLREALLGSLDEGGGFNSDVAQRFADTVGALAARQLLEGPMADCVACLFAARMALHLVAATRDELDWIGEEVLPRLPDTAAWADTRVSMLHEIDRQKRALLKVRAPGSSAARAVRIRNLMQGMQDIDAGLDQAQDRQPAAPLPLTDRPLRKRGSSTSLRSADQLSQTRGSSQRHAAAPASRSGQLARSPSLRARPPALPGMPCATRLPRSCEGRLGLKAAQRRAKLQGAVHAGSRILAESGPIERHVDPAPRATGHRPA